MSKHMHTYNASSSNLIYTCSTSSVRDGWMYLHFSTILAASCAISLSADRFFTYEYDFKLQTKLPFSLCITHGTYTWLRYIIENYTLTLFVSGILSITSPPPRPFSLTDIFWEKFIDDVQDADAIQWRYDSFSENPYQLHIIMYNKWRIIVIDINLSLPNFTGSSALISHNVKKFENQKLWMLLMALAQLKYPWRNHKRDRISQSIMIVITNWSKRSKCTRNQLYSILHGVLLLHTSPRYVPWKWQVTHSTQQHSSSSKW